MFPNAAQVAAETEKEGKSKWLRDAFASAFGEVKEERKSATEELNEAPVPSPELIASEMEGAEPARDSAAMDFAMQEVAAEIGANIKQTGANTGDIESLKRNEVVAPLAFSYDPPAEQPFVPPVDSIPRGEYRGQTLWWDDSLYSGSGGWALSYTGGADIPANTPAVYVYDESNDEDGGMRAQMVDTDYKIVHRDASTDDMNDDWVRAHG